MHKTILIAGLALLMCGCASTPSKPMSKGSTRQVAKLFSSKETRKVQAKYLLYLPPDYKARSTQRWPLILFLHGAGERGTNIWKVAVHGPPKLIQKGTNFPFIVVSPQSPEGQVWSNDVLMGLLDEVMAKYAVDKRRVYLTGLSMGGFGTWSLGLEQPQRFAAIAPICGGGDVLKALLVSPDKSRPLKTLGVWAFHGAKDPVVPLSESERMVEALRRAGCKDVQLTVYPEAQHDSWSQTYENCALYEWFLSHHR